jgi:hypothetical protein
VSVVNERLQFVELDDSVGEQGEGDAYVLIVREITAEVKIF